MAFCLTLVFIAFFWLVRFTQSLLCICSFQIPLFWYSRGIKSFDSSVSSWSFNTCYSFHSGQCHCLPSCSLQSSIISQLYWHTLANDLGLALNFHKQQDPLFKFFWLVSLILIFQHLLLFSFRTMSLLAFLLLTKFYNFSNILAYSCKWRRLSIEFTQATRPVSAIYFYRTHNR